MLTLARLRFTLLFFFGFSFFSLVTPASAALATAAIGQSATFSATAVGSPPFEYQWLKDGIVLPGATNSTYSIDTLSLLDTGVYTAVITNFVGNLQTDTGILTVTLPPPIPTFTQQPVSVAVNTGGTVTLSSKAIGAPSPTYQWRKNGVVIPGATDATYTITNAVMSNAGTYTVVATNAAKSVISSSAVLTVRIAPVITKQPLSATIKTGGLITFTAAATGTPTPTYQWKKNGATIAGATGTSYSLPRLTTANSGTYTFVASSAAGSATSNGAILKVEYAPIYSTQPSSATAIAGKSVTFKCAATGLPTPTYQWRKNGVAIAGATGTSYTIAKVATTSAGQYSVVATNLVGSSYSSAANLMVNVIPAITQQPVTQLVSSGAVVTFSATASGTPAPTYQWRKNGVAITGAKSASYTIAKAAPSDAGTYLLVATNAAGSATSVSATLTVRVGPVITKQPVSQTTVLNAKVTLTVTANGTPTPTYQWRKNGVALTGAASSSYVIAKVAAGNAGTYSVVVSNSLGSTTSANAVLTVNSGAVKPVMTTQPTSKSVTAGAAVTFTAAASGTPTPTYQWRKDSVNIGGATSASFTLANATVDDAGTYSVVATNTAGSVTSTGAVLTVNVTPTILTPPVSQAVTVGAPVTFFVDADGSPFPTYQWNKNGTPIAGATGYSFTILKTAATDTGNYTVTVTNVVTSVTSSVATLKVNAVTPAIVLGADFDGDGNPDIIWQDSGTGLCSFWLMSGTTVSDIISGGTISVLWQVRGYGDFNHDGNPDLIWQNSVTGEARIWLMTGTALNTEVSLGITSTDWEIDGASDFNGDGISDIIWMNTVTGEIKVCLMNGTTPGTMVSFGIISPDWRVTGCGDFDHDGQSDIVWQNAVTGQCLVWLMAGINVNGSVSLGTVPVTMEMCGCGDFNGDGKSDIIWQDSATGMCKVWLMNGTTMTSSVDLGTFPPNWIVRN